MKTRRIWIVVLTALIVATICFIWGNSLKSRSESQLLSLGVLRWIRPLLGAILSPENVTDHLIRKLAHFTEFCALGAEMTLLAALLHKRSVQSALNCLFAGLVVAELDETIQIYSARGSQVSDVLLDFGGVAAGVIGVIFVLAIITKMQKRKGTSKSTSY